MHYSHLEQVLSKRSKALIHGLIISGTLNVALVATFITFALKERKGIDTLLTSSEAPTKKIRLKNKDVLKQFGTMSYDELVVELYSDAHIEHGQRRCDLALAALTKYHDFDIERAFAGFPVEKRECSIDEDSITLYAGVSVERFDGVRQFARKERWPLTSQGLFKQIKNRAEIPESLQEAFTLSQEFFEIKRVFKKLPYAISDEMLFHLSILGDWESIKNFSKEDFISFLLPRMERGSKLAAYLMILEEKEYALKFLDDDQIETLLSLLTEKTPSVSAFLNELKEGIRSDHIRGLAGKPEEHPSRHYRVQAGDSLWKISRMFNVKVEVIQAMNGLDSQTLKPGVDLTLPPDTASSDVIE